MENIENKSIKLNMLLSATRGMLKVLFPLISFPYISRVLGVENLGKYNWASSIISYFILLAGLGINGYAVREGARIRNNRIEFSLFASQVFTINLISTFFSYIFLFVCLISIQKLYSLKSIILILSIQIAFNTIGVEWIYSIFEDYFYITLRSIIFQILSIIMLFTFIKNENDIINYAIVSVLSTSGANLINFVHSKKYCNLAPTRTIQWKRHIKPILVLFAMSVTVTIYVSSDITLLGFLCDDYTVGIYSVSTKVYAIAKNILSSVLIVSIPRLSALLGQNKKREFDSTASDIYNTLITVVFPAITGLIVLRKEVVTIIASHEYFEASSSLAILSVALFFCLGAYFWGQCILVPVKRERDVFNVTLVSAFVNMALNILLMPLWKEKAAAFTTIVAEAITFLWSWIKGKNYVNITGALANFIKVFIGCFSIIIIDKLIRIYVDDVGLLVLLVIFCSIFAYILIELLLKNETIFNVLREIKKNKERGRKV